jgi:glycerol-1-phosphate dehydrogenase [NAD(P)+]
MKDYQGIFGTSFSCSCGRVHQIEPREVVYSDDAMDRLSEVCLRAIAGHGTDDEKRPASDKRVAVLMDVRTRQAAGASAAETLRRGGWHVQELLLPDGPGGKSPVCDDLTKDWLQSRLQETDLLVPVGAGVINDLGKWAAFERGVAFVPFATAASMTGYTSANVAPSVGGLKTLLRAAAPPAVLSAPAVLRDAPYELTTAGLGDMLARPVSSADWRLNNLLFDDYYCERAVGLIAEVEPRYLARPAELAVRKPEAIEGLFAALLLTGVAMTMAGSSSPASGGEHMISHSLDMMAELDGSGHDLHGRQVGVGSVLCAELYRRVLLTESPNVAEPAAEVDAAFWGRLTRPVAEQYAQKLPRLHRAVRLLSRGGTWDRLRERLAPMVPPPAFLHDCLASAGAAFSAEGIGCSRQRLLKALVRAHQVRSRFTVLDLAGLLGLMPACAEEVVGTWA